MFARDGLRVPVATIAADAGVGVATFYRSFADRNQLMQVLESRAYAELNRIIDKITVEGITGLPAIQQFLTDSLTAGDRLILPLHGAPPLIDAESMTARRRIDSSIGRFIEQGREAFAISSEVNATDVIMCSALISQPLRHGPNWDRTARRHIALFVAGMSSARALPGPAVLQSEIEQTFTGQAALIDVQVR